MKEFPIQGCFKFDGKNQNDLITYLKKIEHLMIL